MSSAGSRTYRRRRASLLGAALTLTVLVVGALIARGPVGDQIQSITLPLRHADIIREQSRAKHLDPALVAAVIYQESKFEDRTSSAGATGLMQILPSTALAIARSSGGHGFVPSDLATPRVNISYGTYYLRLLLNHYKGDATLAIAAYNAGQQNVDGWVRRAGGVGKFDAARDIPFPETHAYVESVHRHRRDYRRHYPRSLGLD